MGPREHIPPGFISLYKWRQARRGMLWLSNTILLGPAHKAWPWEEQTSRLPCPSRFADSGLQLPLTALGRGRRGAGRRRGGAAFPPPPPLIHLPPPPLSLSPEWGRKSIVQPSTPRGRPGPVLNATKPSDVTPYPTPTPCRRSSCFLQRPRPPHPAASLCPDCGPPTDGCMVWSKHLRANGQPQK